MLGKLTVFRRGKRVTNQLFRNSIGPVLALWSIYQSASVEMKEAPSPLIIGIVDFVNYFHAHFRCEKLFDRNKNVSKRMDVLELF